MDSYVKNQLKRKVSSFILSEAGKVGNRNTFPAAALVTASSLAALMLSSPSARAASCGDQQCVPADDYCCWEWDPWTQTMTYGCVDGSSPPWWADGCYSL